MEIFIPDNTDKDFAIRRTTHMAIGAHQDDLEVMAYDGIMKCYKSKEEWFMGVVMTDGSGSPRSGRYGGYTNDQMKEVRIREQNMAARSGKYGSMIQLGYPSDEVRDKENTKITQEIMKLLEKAGPRVVYTHNLLDKKDTHVAVAVKTIKAIRELPGSKRPEKLYGCEVWRNLDWMMDEEKIIFDVSRYPKLALKLIKVFKSQVEGGKRYDLAAIGRRLSNATFTSPGNVDTSTAQIYAMDLTPLIRDDNLDVSDYVLSFIEHFADDARKSLERYV